MSMIAVSAPGWRPENTGQERKRGYSDSGHSEASSSHSPDHANRRQGQKRECNVALGNTCHKIYNGIDFLLIKFLQLYYSLKGIEVVPATKLSSEDTFVGKLQIDFDPLSKSKSTSPKATP